MNFNDFKKIVFEESAKTTTKVVIYGILGLLASALVLLYKYIFPPLGEYIWNQTFSLIPNKPMALMTLIGIALIPIILAYLSYRKRKRKQNIETAQKELADFVNRLPKDDDK